MDSSFTHWVVAAKAPQKTGIGNIPADFFNRDLGGINHTGYCQILIRLSVESWGC